MLKINKTRQTTAEFFAIEGELERLVLSLWEGYKAFKE